MSSNLVDAITVYTEEHIASFHAKRLQRVEHLELKEILKRKNPYLYKAKYLEYSVDFVAAIVNAFVSSQEETLFGDFLEGLAVYVAEVCFDARKPSQHELTGIDLLLHKHDALYLVEIKSGPNWGNSSQVTKMVLNFKEAMERLRPLYPNQQIIPVNGCMYGRGCHPQVGKIKQGREVIEELPYLKLCGQAFWEFISDVPTLYLDLIQPLGYRAKLHNDDYQQAYVKLLNRLSRRFMNDFCLADGSIDWERLTAFVSATDENPPSS